MIKANTLSKSILRSLTATDEVVYFGLNNEHYCVVSMRTEAKTIEEAIDFAIKEGIKTLHSIELSGPGLHYVRGNPNELVRQAPTLKNGYNEIVPGSGWGIHCA